MDGGGEALPSAGLYGERGAGGKLKRTSRKPAATPYARPDLAERGQRRWLSRVIDPAYRLIAGGATRLLPSFFSKSNSVNALTALDVEHHDSQQAETEQNAAGDEAKFDNGKSRLTDIAGTSQAIDVLASGSDFNGDKEGDLSNETGLSEIEQLLQGKKFSRDEVDRLMAIINLKAIELPTGEEEKRKQTFTAAEKAKQPIISDDYKISSEEKQEDLSRAVWGLSTPLPHSSMRDEVGASPVEIAKAYMGSRKSEIDISSKNKLSTDERSIPLSDEFSSKPYIPTPYSRPSPCWPGSMVHDNRNYSTPKTEGDRFGLHNFPRTPYSRTIFSKSKSKLTQLQSGNNEGPGTLSTPLKQLQTPIYGKPRMDAVDGGYGSAGPIRRTRHKGATQTPTRGSPYVHSSSIGPSKVEDSSFTRGFLPTVKKNFEPGVFRGNSQIQSLDRKPSSFQAGVPNVHPQSSLIARTILEHIDRNPPTPKDKTEELKRGIAWKQPSSSGVSSGTRNGDDSLQAVGGFSFRKLVNQDYQKSSVDQNADKGKSLFKVPPPVENTAKATDVVSNGPAGDGRRPLVKRTNEDFLKISSSAFGSVVANQQKQLPSQSSASKRVFPSISIDKPDSKWTFSSVNSSGFSFPVSTSSAVFSEPPTPSIMPSLLASSQQHQPKDGDDVPTYEFMSKKSAPLVFSFPSTSAEVENGDLDIKFTFQSDNPKLCFAFDGNKDAICY